MTQSREKIVFALSLLAVLFTVQPILADVKNVGFTISSLHITLLHVYYSVGILLSLSVYLYAINYITTGSFIIQKISNFFYALSLMIPPLYMLVWGMTADPLVWEYVTQKVNLALVLQSFIGSAVAICTTLISAYLSKRLSRRDQQFHATVLTNNEATHCLGLWK